MANSGNSTKWDAIREVAYGSIPSTYGTFGSVLLRDAFRIWITNTTNADIYVSTDGVTNMIKVAANSGRAYDNKTNDMYFKSGTQFYIMYAASPSTAPSTGWFGMEVEYA